jgi:membrane-associated protein
MLLFASGTANKASTFVVLFLAQALSWAGVPALGAAAAGAAGALASRGTLHLWAVLVVGTAGAEVGAMVGWWLGNRVARAGLDEQAVSLAQEGRFAKKRREALDAGEKIEHKWGRLIVFFVPSWVSGALAMRFRQFAVWNLLAALLWNVGASLASYGVASAASGKSALHIIVPLVIGVAALASIYFILRTLLRRRRHRTAEPTVPVA